MSSGESPNLPPRVVNQRRAARKRTLLGGKVVYGEGTFIRDCRIRDVSDTGARIVLPAGEFIPEKVFLLESRRPVAHEAEVSWIKAPEFGLRFLKTYMLKKELPKELAFLGTLWNRVCAPLDGTPVELESSKGYQYK
jgi:hypothetical protein